MHVHVKLQTNLMQQLKSEAYVLNRINLNNTSCLHKRNQVYQYQFRVSSFLFCIPGVDSVWEVGSGSVKLPSLASHTQDSLLDNLQTLPDPLWQQD